MALTGAALTGAASGPGTAPAASHGPGARNDWIVPFPQGNRAAQGHLTADDAYSVYLSSSANTLGTLVSSASGTFSVSRNSLSTSQ